MSILKIYFIFFAISVSALTFAEVKELYVFGGGGEESGKEGTVMDESLKGILSFVRKSNWKMTTIFNGGHARSEKILKSASSNVINFGTFSSGNYYRLIKDIETKLEQGHWKENDKLMIIIATHGMPKMPHLDKSHHVDTLDGSVNVDHLEKIIALAESKKVKFSLIDLSCHSGNTLNLKSENSCIITGAGGNHFGYATTKSFLGFKVGTFSDNFTDNLKENKNLEDIYLEARAEDKTALEFPMISTEEGQLLQDLMYDVLTPYLYYNSTGFENKLKRLYKKNHEENICLSEMRYDSIQKLVEDLHKIEMAINPTEYLPFFEKLKVALKKYQAFQIEYANMLNDRIRIGDKLTEIVVAIEKPKGITFKTYELESILDRGYDKSIEYYENKILVTKDFKSKEEYMYLLYELKEKQKIFKQAFAKLSIEEQKKIELSNKAIVEEEASLKLASNVGDEAKEIYDYLYKKIRREKSNPCRDFVL